MKTILMVLPALAIVVACSQGMDGATAAEGQQIFANQCVACHSAPAEGGALENGLYAPDLTQIAFRNDGVFPRSEVLSKIDGYNHGRKGDRVMPEFGALLTGPDVPVDIEGTLTPTPVPLASLLLYLEQIQKPG